MPTQHRVSEKKRYHYGGGTSGRYGSPSSSSLARNTGQMGHSAERERDGNRDKERDRDRDYHFAQDSGNGTPNSISGGGSPAHVSGGRHSRYDPNAGTGSRGLSSSRPGSRFNPNVTISDSVPNLAKRSVAVDSNNSSNSGSPTSRWAGSHSRYKPQLSVGSQISAPPVSPIVVPTNGKVTQTNGKITPATAPASGAPNTHFYSFGTGAGSNPYSNFANGRSQRPRSSFDNFSSNDNISNANANMNTAATSADMYANTKLGASDTFYKSSKPLSSKFESNSGSSPLSGGRGSYWGTSRVGRTNKYQSGSRYNGFKKRTSEYGPHDMTEIPKATKSFDVAHSLGASLINSVPQTTRKVEEKLHTDHKRIDISEEECTGESGAKSYISQKDKNDSQGSSLENGDESEATVDTNRVEAPTISEVHAKGTDQKPFDDQERPKSPVVESYELPLPPKTESIRGEPVTSRMEKEMVTETLAVKENVLLEKEKEHAVEEGKKEEKDENEEEDEDEEEDEEDEKDAEDEEDENFDEEMNVFQESTGPLAEKSHRPSISVLPAQQPYPEPLVPIEKCIFPMLESEMKLWLLKNRSREERIKDQKYLLKKPVKHLFEYPFFSQTWIIHDQAIKPVILKNLSQIKRYEYLRKLQLKDQFFKLEDSWLKKCKKMAALSDTFLKSNLATDQVKDGDDQENIDHPKESMNQRPSSSRRRNRADFVDDNDIENVLLQIDPDYKHHQLAASIPAMFINPIDRYSLKFKDVNNLVTDKDKWASRLLTDHVDTFTEIEHELFIEGYLAHPKKFGKISNYMGGLRTPEECVLHYYKTKKKSKYKKLLLEKNRKRKASIGRRRKDKSDSKKMDSEEDKTDTGISLPSASEIEKNNPLASSSEALAVEQAAPEEIVPDVEAKPSLTVETQRVIEQNGSTSTKPDIPSVEEPVSVGQSISMQQPGPDERPANVEQPENVVQPEFVAQPEIIEHPPTLAKKTEISAESSKGLLLESTETKKESDTETENEATIDGDSNIRSQALHSTVTVPQAVYMVQEHVLVSSKPNEQLVPSTAGIVSTPAAPNEPNGKVDHPTPSFDGTDSHTKSDDEVSLKHSLSDQSNVDNSEHPMKKKFKQADAAHKSSYWSVQEAKKFPELIKEFGSNWSAISQKLGTKSTTMVKNYFQRKAEQNGWYTIIEMGSNNLATSTSPVSSVDQSTKPISIAPAPNTACAIPVTSLTSPIVTSENAAEKTSVGPSTFQTIPKQQKPAVGFFTDSKLPAIHKPSFSLAGNEDSFSRLPTPTQGLPPPHMPVITSFNVPQNLPKLNINKLGEEQNFNSSNYPNHTKPPTPSVHFPANIPETHHSGAQLHTNNSSRRSSIRSLLNDGEDTESKSNALPNLSPQNVISPSGTASFPILRPTRNTSVSPPSIPASRSNEPVTSNVIVQELSHGIPSKSSVNILNPVTAAPSISPVNADPTHPLQPVPSSINFANDPLAALAAVASSTEAFGLTPATNQGNQTQPPTNEPQVSTNLIHHDP
ncbi:unnamed protein product [Kluyveromyces dobzhanskii CBS 2104]|uniref:WGS project CCBQ000000000 data, contig MAT n=1 Tax=Kluyveromyces dobzhanskii CBS 2104 TaxID=1427455 RepID=A0A0A8L1T3_9SACH|nr:unnamed protein product [Kluyveromyces dobzhanskii CBS 2104]